MSEQEGEIQHGTEEEASAKNSFIKCRIPQPMPSRYQRRPLYNPKRPPVASKRATTDIVKASKNIIKVPIAQEQPTKTIYVNRATTRMPSQETICRSEYVERQSNAKEETDCVRKESLTHRSEKLTKLKICCQDQSVRFEKLTEELYEKQKGIIELYANMAVTHKKITALGEKDYLPAPDELHIMNVSNLTSQQLLQLCAYQSSELDGQWFNVPVSIDDVIKMPLKLIDTCEQILSKNNEIFHELEAVLAAPREDRIKSLSKKVTEFNDGNKMLSSTCKRVKNDYEAQATDITSFVRKCVKETTVLQIRQDKLMGDVSKLKSEKDDLMKQLQEANTRKPNVNNNKLKEMEKLMKEEKFKNAVLKDRLSRTTEQARINSDNCSQSNAALEQSRSNCRALERTVQQLKEENQKIHNDFAFELSKFSDSITENTAHLQEIAETRDKLESEKEFLENRLSELSTTYNESMKNINAELSSHIAKVIEIEKKYTDEKEEKLKLIDKTEFLCGKLCESELRYKDLCLQLQQKDTQINKCADLQTELENTKNLLNTANQELDKYRAKFVRENEVLKESERNLKQSVNAAENLKNDLTNTKEYATKLEEKVVLLEKRLQSSEYEVKSYEAQQSSLKRQISQIKEDYGDFENFNELREMINRQQIKSDETIKHNTELVEAIKTKDLEMDRYIESISGLKQAIEERNDIIKMLSDKEEEHTNIITLLRNNLEMRNQADKDANQQISEKNSEIDCLVKNIRTKDEQINQLEKIILTLEEQTHKASTRSEKYQQNVKYLENKLTEHESFCRNQITESPTKDLDNIMNILEEEIYTPISANLFIDNLYSKQTDYCGISNNSQEKYSLPTKIIHEADRQNDKSHAHIWVNAPEQVSGKPLTCTNVNNTLKDKRCEIYLTRNVNFSSPIQLRNNKMFKIARHKI